MNRARVPLPIASVRRAAPLALFAVLSLPIAACSGNEGATSSSSSSSSNGGGAGVGGAGGGGGASSTGVGKPAAAMYPDLATLHDLGVSRTCSLNQGVCHSQKDYPELTSAMDLLHLVGAPCQIGAQTPESVLDACEVPGDVLTLGGVDHEIWRVEVDAFAPFPPRLVTLKLASAPASLRTAEASIRRLDASNKAELLARPLSGVKLAWGSDAQRVVLDLDAATDKKLAAFLDTRAFDGDRVRMGDPNNNGVAHGAKEPWGEVVPGDPTRSFFYRRLQGDKLGALMPLIPRTWTPAATRAVWCWIKGLPPSATPTSIGLHDPIQYEGCSLDPEVSDPGAPFGWMAVRTLLGSKCATANCHAAGVHAGGLDLSPTAAAFQKNVIGVSSSQTPGALRVAPGQPAASYLLCKVDPKCEARARGTAAMPLGAQPLGEEEIKTLADWIASGAPTE